MIPWGSLNFRGQIKIMERTFKILFFLGVIVFCVITILLFLIALKVILLFTPQISLLGMQIQ